MRNKVSHHYSEIKHAKVERHYVHGIRLKPLRKAAARAERRAAKLDIRNWEAQYAD